MNLTKQHVLNAIDFDAPSDCLANLKVAIENPALAALRFCGGWQ